MAEVTVLEGFGREAELRRKWLRMWEQLGAKFQKITEQHFTTNKQAKSKT